MEKSTSNTNIRLPNILHPINNCRSNSPSNPIIIRLPNTSKRSDIRLDEVMLRQIRDTLFCDDEIRFEFQDFIAHGLDLLFFDLKDFIPVCLLCNFDVGLRFAFLVFEGTVKQDNTGISYY